MMILKRAAHVYSGGLAAIAIASAVLSGCGSSNGDTTIAQTTKPAAQTTNPAPVHGTYSPAIDPASFSSTVDNRYFPLTPGSVTRARGVAENGTTPQVDRAAVTNQTKRIIGVDTVVVLDPVRALTDSLSSERMTGTPRTRRATCGTSGRTRSTTRTGTS